MKSSNSWLKPASALWLLSAVPIAAGALRLFNLWTGQSVDADSARFVAAPQAVVWHILSSSIFCVLGAVQLTKTSTKALVRHRARWHRRLGWMVIPCGFASALSGLWMTSNYPIPAQLQGDILYGVRWIVGLGMAVSIVLATRAVLMKQFAAHRAWMVRAYALGQGAGTQVLLLLPATLAVGPLTALTRDIMMSLAWGVNWLIAERLIRRASSHVPST